MTTEAGARRRRQILIAAAALFAERGYHGVGIDELGARIGVTGPALYRHFAGKDALLGELLLDASRRLHADAVEISGRDLPPIETLRELVTAHVRFAVDSPDIIRVQDRDLANLGVDPRGKVRRLQREYVEMWVSALQQVIEGLSSTDGRSRVHVAFGMTNSTPYSARGQSPTRMIGLLRDMCLAALCVTETAAIETRE